MTTQSHESLSAATVEVGERIHTLMWRKKISQAQMGAAIGVGQSTMSGKIRGRVPMTVHELMTIAGVLGVDPGELLPRLDSNQQPSGYVSLQASNVIRLLPRELPGSKSPPGQNLGNTAPTGGDRRGNSGRVIEWGARQRGHGSQSARVE